MNLGLIPRLNYKFSFCQLVRSLLTISNSQEVKNKLRIWFGDSPLFYDSGRSALLMALQSFHFPEGTKAGLMIYNCHTVFNAIRLAGFTPVFIDVNEDFTLDLDDLAFKSQEMKILIVSHLFGIVTNIDNIRKRFPNLIIIEDCAHAFLSQSGQGNLAGTEGDLAVFSLNSAKFPSIGGGGFLLVNNRQTIERIEKCSTTLKQMSVCEEIKHQIIKLIICILHQSFFYKYITFPVKNFRAGKKINTYQNYVPKAISRVDTSQFNNFLDKERMILQKQIKYFKDIAVPLNILKGVLEHTNGFMVPLLYKGDQKAILRKFYKKGIELGQHFSQSLVWAKDFGYIPGSCKTAEFISTKIITIPCYYSLTIREYQKILKHIPELIK